MKLEDWLIQQQALYPDSNFPQEAPPFAIHPVSGEWQETPSLIGQFCWGGGASREAFQQLQPASDRANLTHLCVLTFGPVQHFLGGGRRLRDWAVASWLCHYLTAAIIFRWEDAGGEVLLPLHRDNPLLAWMGDPPQPPLVRGESDIARGESDIARGESDIARGESDIARGELESEDELEKRFWQAELPNVITGLLPELENIEETLANIVREEWGELIRCLEEATREYDRIHHNPRLLDGIGWRALRDNHRYLWSVYVEIDSFAPATARETSKTLHEKLEADKLARNWQGTGWGGRTSPTAGSLSVWHPGLRPFRDKGKWGLPPEQLDQWWTRAAAESRLSNLFSTSDRLNSIELVKRLASIPEIIERTLHLCWGKEPPSCPWDRFPDRAATAAAWVTQRVPAATWNREIEAWHRALLGDNPRYAWGIPACDDRNDNSRFAHPRILERRNLEEADPAKATELKQKWDESIGKAGWESAIEWTVGWRGDGDNMGKWLSGQQYATLNLSWSKWHPTPEQITQYNLNLPAPEPSSQPRQLEIPHILDLSILFGQWNALLYPLTEDCHPGRVIFAGGDDFLLLGPLTEFTSLTTDLYRLWRGQPTPITDPIADGWVRHQQRIYPVPGTQMDFSLGVVIAQRRVPQSLLHRGLNEAYKTAKQEGKNCVCVKVLFNSGQSLQWVCPWPLWELLMHLEPQSADHSDLNRWEKLLFYLDSTRLQEASIFEVKDLLITLWQSVGLNLTWEAVIEVGEAYEDSLLDKWQWWLDWISLRGFLTRQEQAREKWVEQLIMNNE
ncbi:MAG: type III-B CRISPR-associated protein Cas10/Cmr2 [Cyanobacteriota bacterium]|nr:type III-B CRISPR-associated protein Cas10/Cmr2 [Cyanobacteriota bacterium]